MPIFSSGNQQVRQQKKVEFVWDTFRKGLNTLLRENEVDPQELTQADNILLKGKGIPTKRWGTSLYYTAGNATGSVRGLSGFYKSDGTNELLAITDDGYLTKKNGTSFSTLTGASWASGYNVYMAQLSNKMYIVNGQRELVRYSSPTLVGFPTIAIPVITGATNLSNATGSTTKAYRVTAISQVGETLGSTEFTLANQPATLGDPAGGTIRLTWTGVSTASGILQGFNIYGRDGGNERFIAGVVAGTTFFDDDGSAIPSEFTFPPTADTTGGPKAKFIMRFQDRLVFAGIAGEPSKVVISGREPNQEKFDISYGGNYINIEKDSGDDIVQIASFRDRIIVFKQRSIWQITLSSEQVGNFFVTTPNLQLITNSYGCVASRSVVPVENDLYFLSRTGVNTLGYQTGFAFDLLRSNEISIKVRPYFEALSISQKMNAVATYFNKRFIIAFPGLNQSMVFDTERAAWVGPWTVDAQVFEKYFDTDSNEHLLLGHDDSVSVDEMSDSYTTDNGTAIATTLKTRQEDFGDWSLYKNIRNLFVQFRNITGSTNVDIRLEQRNGLTITANSFSVLPNNGDSGWGADLWGSALWGSSNTAGGNTDSAQQIIRWRELNKTARTIQMTVKTSNTGDNYELLGIRGDATPQGSGVRPHSWKT
jgi:hypothetical protein